MMSSTRSTRSKDDMRSRGHVPAFQLISGATTCAPDRALSIPLASAVVISCDIAVTIRLFSLGLDGFCDTAAFPDREYLVGLDIIKAFDLLRGRPFDFYDIRELGLV